MEKDDELKGEGSSLDFGARIYDPRIGRWLSIDPLFSKSPDKSEFNFVFNSPLVFIDPDGEYPQIVITDEVTGYTVSKVYGRGKSLAVVPTYKMIVYDVAADGTKTIMGTAHVTRDGWFKLGEKAGKEHLVNYTTEPLTKNDETNAASENSVASWDSPTRVVAIAEMWAEERPTETYDDGTPLGPVVKRSNPKIAKGVQIHVGGVYTEIWGDTKIGGTYGCFGVMDISQVFSTEIEAEEMLTKLLPLISGGTVDLTKLSIESSNDEMNRFNQLIQDAIENAEARSESDASDTKATIIKRGSYENEKTVKAP